jgi:predicted nucleotidyltransferase
MQQFAIEEAPSEITRLEGALGKHFANLEAARKRAGVVREKFEMGVSGLNSDDTTIVVFGSLARGEFTDGSDVDWTVLIDGVANPKHLDLARQVKQLVDTLEARQPGPEGIFGNMAFSHQIIHQIGGEDDTNRNTTQRILLMLESMPIGRRGAYDRVLNHVLTRYIAEDSRFLQKDARFHVPRFLLNDFARYWRTMAVDFAYKRRVRAGDGAALRNLKLRISRKLTFVSGLLACFSLHLLLPETERAAILTSRDPAHEFVRYMRNLLSQTPLELVAAVVNRYPHLHGVGERLFQSYDEFLGILCDKEMRKHLNELAPGNENKDTLYQAMRRTSHVFRAALLELFFDNDSELMLLTKTYGVF